MSQAENKTAVEHLWRAFDERRFDDAGDALHDDVVVEWPHSGERMVGRDAFIAVNRDHPDPWIRVEVLRIVAEGDVVVSEVVVPVEGQRSALAASFFTFEDGKIVSITEYWVDAGSQAPYPSRAGVTEPL
ncbi:MAG TPA: nuclear transport factor 2 family protein [Egibacteraceae bacterium]|nr:nuclear transport factor 2 family protein [Egibacteraceae bacterium]